ncbi:MAG: hypothetical protein IKJ68_11905, partial [Clostridia bacterium]|nr:hypothetical protein [Clostridia bacterium]
MKKIISLLISCIMVLQMCLVLPGFAVFAEDGTAPEPKILLNEDYTTDAEGSAFANREALGWTQEPTEYGKNPYAAMSFDSGLKLHQTGNQQYVNSLFRRKFTVTENGNDDYMKIRRINFKGIYDLEVKMTMTNDASYKRNII